MFLLILCNRQSGEYLDRRLLSRRIVHYKSLSSRIWMEMHNVDKDIYIWDNWRGLWIRYAPSCNILAVKKVKSPTPDLSNVRTRLVWLVVQYVTAVPIGEIDFIQWKQEEFYLNLFTFAFVSGKGAMAVTSTGWNMLCNEWYQSGSLSTCPISPPPQPVQNANHHRMHFHSGTGGHAKTMLVFCMLLRYNILAR